MGTMKREAGGSTLMPNRLQEQLRQLPILPHEAHLPPQSDALCFAERSADIPSG